MAAAGLAQAWNGNVIRPAASPADEDLDELRGLARQAIAGAAEPSLRSVVATAETGKSPGKTILEVFREARLT